MKLYHLLIFVSLLVVGCSPTLPDGESFDTRGTPWRSGDRLDRPGHCCGCDSWGKNGEGWFWHWNGDYYYNHDYHGINKPWWYCTTCYELVCAIKLWENELNRLEMKYARVKFDDQEKYLRKKVEQARSYRNRYKNEFLRKKHKTFVKRLLFSKEHPVIRIIIVLGVCLGVCLGACLFGDRVEGYINNRIEGYLNKRRKQ